MKKLLLAAITTMSVACLTAPAAPLAGCHEITPPGAWSELLLGGQPGQPGNEITAGDGDTYLFGDAKLAEVQADQTGEWDWLTKYTGGTLILSNVPAAPWFTPCENAAEFVVAFPEVWVKTRSTRFAATNAGYLEFSLVGESDSYKINAAYAGTPTYTVQDTNIIASGDLTGAEICIGARVRVDILPGSCPNPLNVKSKGVLPVAILGSEKLSVRLIDPATIKLECIPALRWAYEDVSGDGVCDLTLKFDRQSIIQALPPLQDRDVIPLILTGLLKNGTPIAGSDEVTILKPGKLPNVVPPAQKPAPQRKEKTNS